MAEADISTSGGFFKLASVWDNNRVPVTRLERILAFLLAVQRSAAMLSPARCTTASSPSSELLSISPDSGLQRMSPCAGYARTSLTTSWHKDVRKGIS